MNAELPIWTKPMTTRQSEPDGEKGDLLKRLFMLIATLFILSATTIIVLASGAFNGEGEALDTTFVRTTPAPVVSDAPTATYIPLRELVQRSPKRPRKPSQSAQNTVTTL